MTSSARAWRLSAGLWLGCAAVAAAGEPVPPPAVEGQVRTLLSETWDVPAASVACAWGFLPQSLRQRGGEVTQLIGQGVDGWYAAVIDVQGDGPLSVRVRAGVRDSVLVSRRPLAAGTVLGAGDITRELRVRWGPPGASARGQAALGWEVRRPVPAGELLEEPAVAPPFLVRAGDTVELAWTQGAVVVAVEGRAVTSARLGERVLVRVPDRRKPLRGTVVGPGRAALPGGET